MKKLLVVLVALFTVNVVSAQVNNVGLRFNGGIEIAGQYDLSKANYIEGRIGFGGNINLTGIYTWHIKDFNWTPQFGKWFFDAGVGANLGFGHSVNAAVVGSAKLGFKFNDAPVSLMFDVCPVINLIPGFGAGIGSGFSIVYHF